MLHKLFMEFAFLKVKGYYIASYRMARRTTGTDIFHTAICSKGGCLLAIHQCTIIIMCMCVWGGFSENMAFKQLFYLVLVECLCEVERCVVSLQP